MKNSGLKNLLSKARERASLQELYAIGERAAKEDPAQFFGRKHAESQRLLKWVKQEVWPELYDSLVEVAANSLSSWSNVDRKQFLKLPPQLVLKTFQRLPPSTAMLIYFMAASSSKDDTRAALAMIRKVSLDNFVTWHNNRAPIRDRMLHQEIDSRLRALLQETGWYLERVQSGANSSDLFLQHRGKTRSVPADSFLNRKVPHRGQLIAFQRDNFMTGKLFCID